MKLLPPLRVSTRSDANLFQELTFFCFSGKPGKTEQMGRFMYPKHGIDMCLRSKLILGTGLV